MRKTDVNIEIKKKIYPSNLLQVFLTLFFPILITTPFIVFFQFFINDNNEFIYNLKVALIALLYLTFLILFVYYKNQKRAIKFNLKLPPFSLFVYFMSYCFSNWTAYTYLYCTGFVF